MIADSSWVLACPVASCRRALRPRHPEHVLVCEACGETYPLVMGALPVVIADPYAHLAHQALDLARGRRSLRGRIEAAVQNADLAPDFADTFQRQAAALSGNLALIDRMQAYLLDHLSPSALVAAAAAAGPERSADPKSEYGADRLWAYLRRDWGGEPESELEVHRLAEAALRALHDAARPAGPVLVLGAGMGRIADILARAGMQIVAVEPSLPFSIARQLLWTEALEISIVGRRNRRTADDIVRTVICKRPPDSAKHLVPTWIVGDAVASPFVQGSFAAVVSCYFSDVVRPSRWLPEVLRVLAPGGRFIHVGPLGFHFDDELEQVSADLFAHRLEQHGLTVQSTDWLQTTQDAPGQLSRGVSDNLVLVATKDRTEPDVVAERDDELIPCLVGTAVVEVTSSISNRSRSVDACRVRAGDGRSCALSELGPSALESIDGERTLREVLARVGEHVGGPLSEDHRAAVMTDIEKLVAIGAVRRARRRDS